MSVAKKIQLISNREDFVLFVYELSKSFRTNPESWENKDLGAYLEALAAWVEDMDGYYLERFK